MSLNTNKVFTLVVLLTILLLIFIKYLNSIVFIIAYAMLSLIMLLIGIRAFRKALDGK